MIKISELGRELSNDFCAVGGNKKIESSFCENTSENVILCWPCYRILCLITRIDQAGNIRTESGAKGASCAAYLTEYT